MILLDTNICIYIINAKPPAVLARFQKYRLGDIGVCSVVYSLREMLGAEGHARRQKNPNQIAKDTTQSRFQCLFTDCGVTYHADAGAAINIGRKFFSTVVDVTESIRAMEQTMPEQVDPITLNR